MNTETTTLKPSFTLSKSNKIYLLIIISLVVIANTWVVMQLVSYGGASSEAVGQMVGQLIFSVLLRYLLIPAFVAYIVWVVRGKTEKAGRTAFNITLTIMLIIQILGTLATLSA